MTPEEPVEEAPQDIVCWGGIRIQLGAGNGEDNDEGKMERK